MAHFNLLVIGGDAAGMSSASQARRLDEKMSIGVFNKGAHVSYAACGMPYFIGDEIKSHKNLLAINVDKFREKRNIEIFSETEITSLDFEAKKATAQSNGKEESHTWDKLVIATGARAFLPPIPGIDNTGVFALRSLEHGIAIKEYIEKEDIQRAVIIGGGFIGLEMAEAFVTRGISTTILERLDDVAMTMSPTIRQLVNESLGEKNVALHTGIAISEIKKEEKCLCIKTDALDFEADIVIVSTGVMPNTEFLKDTGLAMTDRGVILVNERSETSIPDVYAAGDCATVKHLVTGENTWMPLGTTANKQGRVAGIQAAGVKSEKFAGIVGSQQVKVFELEVAKTGLNMADAHRAGIPAEEVTSTWKSRAGYYPGAEKVTVLIAFNRESRKIIGGEIAGTDLAALRINTLATAITAGMTIDDFAYTDLAYAPPFSPVWDPTIATAQLALKRK